jgi:HEAT repeat protein
MLWWTLKQIKADDWKSRETAAMKLGELNDPRYAEHLVEALADSHPSVRRAAEHALVQMGAPVVPGLATQLRNRNPDVRKATARALAQIGEPAVPVLGMALNDSELPVRELAAAVLGRIGSGSAIEQLTSALRYGHVPAKEAAAFGLAQLGTKALDPLISALRDTTPGTNSTAAAALIRIGKPAVPRLIAALGNSDAWESATEALSRIDPDWSKSDAAKGALSAFLVAINNQDPRKRRAAAVVLGHIGNSDAVTHLIEALRDPDDQVRTNAAIALGEVGDPRAVLPLISALANAASDGAVPTALVQLATGLVGPLVDALKSRDKQIRQSAASVLVQVGHSAIGPLAEVLWKIDPELAAPETPEGPGPRFVATSQSNGDAPDKKPEPRISAPRPISPGNVISAQKEPKRGLIKASQTNFPSTDARDVQVLAQGLEAPDTETRTAAIRDLVTIGAGPTDPLHAALRDRNQAVRRTAAHALIATGDVRAREVLRADLDSVSDLVTLDAAESLMKLGDPRVTRPMAKMLADLDDLDCEADPSIHYKAIRALQILRRILTEQLQDVVIEDLNQIIELRTRRAPRFLSAIQAVASGAKDTIGALPTGILEQLKATEDFQTVMELANREQTRRKRA